MIVSNFVKDEVSDNLIELFRKEMEKWDSLLIGLSFNHYPTYDKDVLETMLQYAIEKENGYDI